MVSKFRDPLVELSLVEVPLKVPLIGAIEVFAASFLSLRSWYLEYSLSV